MACPGLLDDAGWMSGAARTLTRGLAVAAAVGSCGLVLADTSPADRARVLQARRRAESQGRTSSSTGGRGAGRSSSSGTLLEGTPVEADEAAGAASRPESDPLVTNGLGSPSCRSSLDAELPVPGRRNCETSGFTAAAAPTDNYGLDVHIDTGLLPLSSGSVLSTVQSLLVTPQWLGLVWLVHSLVVMLEWCFSLDLIDSASADGLTAGLASAEASFTTPLLALALAVAATLVAYHGLVRRRIAETLGEAAMTVAMLAGGLWLMLDPAGTVGALSRLSDRAALGTMAVAAEGSPVAPSRALGTNLSSVFAAAIEAPWCYLEFGDVAWCRDAGALEPNLHTAALRIAARERSEAGCLGSAGSCGQTRNARGLLASARLIGEARTNGALFLALPPNGPDRNSINDGGSLLRALCGTSEATACTGPGATEAEFRTGGGTWARITGLLLIAIGLLGMLLLFGYVAIRLLTAAAMSLVYLLLSPGVVVLPALGERGRALFRAWIGRLLGAVLSKLLFAFLLGVLLAVSVLVEDLRGLGWWAQWLLLSAFWWATFLRRHQLLAMPPDAIAEARRLAARTRFRTARETIDTARSGAEWRERRHERRHRMASADAERSAELSSPRAERRSAASVRAAPVESPADEQALRMLRVHADRSRGESAAATARIARRAPRRERIERAWRAATAAGDTRLAARLAVRRDRLVGEDAADEVTRARAAGSSQGGGGPAGRRERVAERVRFLESQARLPAAGERRGGERRDYAALAGLVHRSRREYEQLAPGPQRAARLEIDRELAARRLPSATGHRASRELRRHEDADGPGATSRRRHSPPPKVHRPVRRRVPVDESPVMQDARAVAEGRKRQLGIGRP